jgi:hypothetical protein
MRSPRWWVLAGVVSVSLFCAPSAKAAGSGTVEGGTITFTGAIVEPTCGVTVAPSELNPAVDGNMRAQANQHSCFGPGGQQADVEGIYAQSVVRLSDAEQDRVLNYFDSYVRAGSPNGAAPVLVTQTYE